MANFKNYDPDTVMDTMMINSYDLGKAMSEEAAKRDSPFGRVTVQTKKPSFELHRQTVIYPVIIPVPRPADVIFYYFGYFLFGHLNVGDNKDKNGKNVPFLLGHSKRFQRCDPDEKLNNASPKWVRTGESLQAVAKETHFDVSDIVYCAEGTRTLRDFRVRMMGPDHFQLVAPAPQPPATRPSGQRRRFMDL